jgi:hypothetical protein
MNSYEELVAALAGDGILCYLQSPDQLVVSAQTGAPWPDRGNSFWVTRAGGAWHLFTWAPRGYLVPSASDVAALCRTCLSHGTRAMGAAPAEIVEQYALRELTDDEAEDVYAQMASE